MKLDHVTILVTSLERSMPYYEQLLPLVGFTKQRDHVWTDGDGFFFQFLQAKPDTSEYERYGAGMNHLGFSAPTKEHVESIQISMRKAGFEAPEIQNLGGVTALFMKDPDGIRFEVSYYPPGTNVVD
ncbi:VOC family protein [Kangiella koreensis]|uniref:Glyoxalase/bleomycin resistance protein/dioxygenase n=1 Tax=Kangiella koreensis (strain DSM 16069 / JCM 12317 / KCTC 12182 / SW-125) TaxID=523791 RepID=C7R5X4_KANKD|nr:VOC family protein [Kangiella koreensis]ACV27298.1 Glyoxalase/bleomycin resistance protein/dioxygenase [Kangiella koreensis DSM 16069]